jgi:hypothetical protein
VTSKAEENAQAFTALKATLDNTESQRSRAASSPPVVLATSC